MYITISNYCYRHDKLASWASVYTDALFRKTSPPARFAKPACWGHPQSPYDCQLRCQAERRFTPLVTITYNKKSRARQIRNPSISALPFSSLLLQFFPLLSGGFPLFLQVIAIELLHVLSGFQHLLHFPFCFPVVFVSFFLLNDQLRVFLPELFDRRQLGSSRNEKSRTF